MAYSTNLTADDTNAGFQLLEVKLGQCGVVYRLGPSDRIVKTVDPKGVERYLHQRYGRRPATPAVVPKWMPAFDHYSQTPSLAVATGVRNMLQSVSEILPEAGPGDSPCATGLRDDPPQTSVEPSADWGEQ